jgi:hypothetical protein
MENQLNLQTESLTQATISIIFSDLDFKYFIYEKIFAVKREYFYWM